MNLSKQIGFLALYLWISFNSSAQVVVLDLKLECNRINPPALDFKGEARVTVDCDSPEWIIQYQDHNQKFAQTYGGFILEKPDFKVKEGSQPWYMVSTATNGYPLDLDGDERLVWFLYCGRDYIRKNEGKPAVLPFGDARKDAYVHGCRLKAHWRTDSDLSPETVDFVYDAAALGKGLTQLSFEPQGSFLNDREKSVKSYMSNHTNDEVVASLKVSRWLNVGGKQVPAEWALNLFWYGQPSFTFKGTVEGSKVAPAGEKIGLPPIESPARVTDKRIRDLLVDINSVNYHITNGQIPKMEQVRLPRKDSQASQMPPDLKKTRFFFLGAIALTCLLPVWFFSKNLLGRTRNNNNQN